MDKKLEAMSLEELKQVASKAKITFPKDVNEIGLIALINEKSNDLKEGDKSNGDDKKDVVIDSPNASNGDEKTEEEKSKEKFDADTKAEEEKAKESEVAKSAESEADEKKLALENEAKDKKKKEREKAVSDEKDKAEAIRLADEKKTKVEKVTIAKNSAPTLPKEDKGVKIQLLMDIPSIQVGGQRFSFKKGHKGVEPTGIAGHLIRTGAAIKV